MRRPVTLSWLMSAVLGVLVGCAEGERQEVDAALDRAVEGEATTVTTEDVGTAVAGEQDAGAMKLTGTIRHLDIEGGIYVIASGGTNYNPTNLAEEFQQDGLAVEAEVRQLDDQASIGMVGPMVEVVEIRSAGEQPAPAGAQSEAEAEVGEEATQALDPAQEEPAVEEAAEPTAADPSSAEEAEEAVEGEEAATTPAPTAAQRPTPQPGGDSELWGSGWQLADLGGRPAMGQVQVTLEFPDEGGRAVGNASCNRFFGQVSVQGESIAFLDIGTMKMACQPAVNDQEHRFLTALEAADRYELEDDELRVYGADTEQPLVFSRIAEEG